MRARGLLQLLAACRTPPRPYSAGAAPGGGPTGDGAAGSACGPAFTGLPGKPRDGGAGPARGPTGGGVGGRAGGPSRGRSQQHSPHARLAESYLESYAREQSRRFEAWQAAQEWRGPIYEEQQRQWETLYAKWDSGGTGGEGRGDSRDAGGRDGAAGDADDASSASGRQRTRGQEDQQDRQQRQQSSSSYGWWRRSDEYKRYWRDQGAENAEQAYGAGYGREGGSGGGAGSEQQREQQQQRDGDRSGGGRHRAGASSGPAARAAAYETLGLAGEARAAGGALSAARVRAAFTAEALVHHPDQVRGGGPAAKAAAEARFRRLVDARRTLLG